MWFFRIEAKSLRDEWVSFQRGCEARCGRRKTQFSCLARARLVAALSERR